MLLEDEEETTFVIREMCQEDEAFVNHSWLLSYKDSSEFAKLIPKDIYFNYHHQVVKNILQRSTAKCFIACAEQDPDLIYGYAIFESIAKQNIFHYIYVKKAFGGQFGITKALINAAPFPINNSVYASHMTYKGRRIIDKYDLIYCPYLL